MTAAHDKVERLLRTPTVPAELELEPAEFDAALTAVTAALDASRVEAPRPRRAWWPLALVAAAALLAVGVWTWPRAQVAERVLVADEVTAADVHGDRPVVPGEALREGLEVSTAATGRLVVAFGDRRRVTVAPDSRVTWVHGGERAEVRVLRGGVLAESTRVGGVLVFETAHGFVELREGRVSLEVRAPSDACPLGDTVVRALAGSVELRAVGLVEPLRSGQERRLGCASAEAVAPQAPTALPAPPSVQPPAPSSLAQMNRLYERAVAAKQAGRLAEAATLFERVRKQFPGGPLDEAAAVERLRLLMKLDARAARQAAEAYLREFPGGYAVDVAESVLRGPP